MQVIKDGIVIDHYISKNLPKNPSMKLLSHNLKYAKRLIKLTEDHIKQKRSLISINEAELKRVKDIKMRKKIEKCIEEERYSIKRALHNLEVEKEDLEVLENIISETEWKLYAKQISMF